MNRFISYFLQAILKIFNIKLSVSLKKGMRTSIGLAAVAISIFFFGWWGFLSLIIVLPFIGWPERHKGPFSVKTGKTTDASLAKKVANDAPKANNLMQNLLVKASKSSTKQDEIIELLSYLVIILRTELAASKDATDQSILLGFIFIYSEAYPNWQPEYKFLKDLIATNFN